MKILKLALLSIALAVVACVAAQFCATAAAVSTSGAHYSVAR